jgi:aminoglycoside 2'-N-acetyltransferase I
VNFMSPGLAIEQVGSAAMNPAAAAEVRALCEAAYGEEMASYLADIGPGVHLLCRREGRLVTHLMWVTRWLQPEGGAPLRTAYVELVATAPGEQRRGYASALLASFPPLVEDFHLAALAPATEGIYTRLGWRYWLGPLATRKDGRLIPTPEDRIMILTLPRTPPLDLHLPLSVEWRPGEVW